MEAALIFPERRRNIIVEGRGEMGDKLRAFGPDKEREVPAAHIVSFSRSFGEFTSTAGLTFFNKSDLYVMSVEARECGKYWKRHRRQAEQIPIPVLGKWEDLVLRSKPGRPGRLLSRSIRVELASGLMC